MRYEINEKKRTIVAIIDECEYDLIRYIMKHSRDIIVAYDPERMKDLLLKSSYSGVARCNPEDEWSEEKGKYIAYVRAMRAYESDRLNKLNRLIKKYTNTFTNLIEDQTNRKTSYYSENGEDDFDTIFDD